MATIHEPTEQLIMRIAIVGLGAMGTAIAERLLASGQEVVVWNRTPERAKPLIAAGARVAARAGEAANASDLVITMVTDPAALVAVTEHEQGVIPALRADSLLVEMSTVGPAAIGRLAQRLPEGTSLLDAPVLGSVRQAQQGVLKIFVGGDQAALERARPILELLGEVLHVGPLGAGAAAKLVANSTLFGVLAVLGEAIALGEALGLTRSALLEVLRATPVAEQAERRWPSIIGSTYPRRFGLSLARKDSDLIAAAAARARVDLRVATGAGSWLADADAAGWGELDYSAVLAMIIGEPRPSG
ncbi:MAG: NAD(P)-dependent oxidoreductase [Acidimicrobiia bacterium]